MRSYPQLDRLLDQAENAQCCAHSNEPLIQKGLHRRYLAGDLVKPYPGLYARAEYWNRLNAAQQSLHTARTLKELHGNWVFAGITAAAAYDFEHQWLLHNQELTITRNTRGSHRSHSKLNIIYSPFPKDKAVTVNGIPVTNPARTLLDCGQTLEFQYALPIFDSAGAQGISSEQVLQECTRTTRDCTPIFKLMQHTNPISENGGESFARGTMIESGFSTPQLQVPFTDPETGEQFRVDFLWNTNDGKIIVGEFDGTAKYVNPEMTGRKGIQETVRLERNREDALRRAGVTEIVRFTFDDVLQRKPMIAKLRRAGIPTTS